MGTLYGYVPFRWLGKPRPEAGVFFEAPYPFLGVEKKGSQRRAHPFWGSPKNETRNMRATVRRNPGRHETTSQQRDQ